MMCRWLPDEAVEKCNIPPYCHTMLSVGGLVTDSQGRLLVIKEKFWKIPNWKLPGGYIENRKIIKLIHHICPIEIQICAIKFDQFNPYIFFFNSN